jgi:GNAT superfamily N-acetyltransferase
MCGPDAWLAAVRAVVPPLAAAFGPDVIVSQHGADGHVWDPLAHLSLTTTAMGEAARLVDRMAHRYAGGRWFATGGGGYSIYRVVPRVWALTWLAGAHMEAPRLLPAEWRARWEGDAARWDDAPLPEAFEDAPSVLSDRSISAAAAERAEKTVLLVRTVLVPALLRVAESLGWRQFDGDVTNPSPSATPAGEAPPARRDESAAESSIRLLTAADLDALSLAPRVIAPADTMVAAEILRTAVRDGAVAVGAVAGEWLVGVALAAPASVRGADGADGVDGVDQLVALGVAPEWRRGGVATAMLRALVIEGDRKGRGLVALHTAAERDPIDPLPRAVRREVAERLAARAGLSATPVPPHLSAVDPAARMASRVPSEILADS